MAAAALCLAQFSKLSLSTARQNLLHTAKASIPIVQVRHKGFKPRILSKKEKAALLSGPSKSFSKKKPTSDKNKKKKKLRSSYQQYNPKDAITFSLCDAMRYLRAFEVGRPPTSSKYEVHLKLKSLKNGPVIRNRLRLPHPVKTNIRICVICPPDSKYAASAKAAGATLVGEEEIFEAVKDGRIEFDRCIAQSASLAKMNKAGMGRFLGPKGLMPSAKMGTVVKDPSVILKDLIGGSEYRERLGVVRMAVGQLAFTPEEMQRNLKAFIVSVKKDMAQLSDKINKELVEVVLSSTHGPGFILNGEFRDLNSSLTPQDLSTQS